MKKKHAIQYHSQLKIGYHVHIQRLAQAYTRCLIANMYIDEIRVFYDFNSLQSGFMKNLETKLFHLFIGDTRLKLASAYGNEIIIQVSENVLHQITSRVFGTLAKEILNQNVTYENIQFSKDSMELTEKEKLYDTLEQIVMYGNQVINVFFL